MLGVRRRAGTGGQERDEVEAGRGGKERDCYRRSCAKGTNQGMTRLKRDDCGERLWMEMSGRLREMRGSSVGLGSTKRDECWMSKIEEEC